MIEVTEQERIPRDKENDYSQCQVSKRLNWLENKLGKSFEYLGGRKYSTEMVKGTCENYIGNVTVPVGLAGPLHIRGNTANGVFYVPLATTEGALVASMNRGMRIITESGGCNVSSFENRKGKYRFWGDVISKVSAIVLKSNEYISEFNAWLDANINEIEKNADDTSGHIKFTELIPLYQGRIVGLLIKYQTEEAMGLNMATKANEAVCRYICEHCSYAEEYFNTLGGDKRFVNSEGKGKYVIANVTLSKEKIESVLKTTPERMHRYLEVCHSVLAQQGSTAMNIHAANAITAMYIACGQDPAFVTVSFKNAITDFELTNAGGLHVSVTLPNLIVGTVGGGTKLPIQAECIEMLGCTGNSRKLAEIIAATVLAGEISVAGAVGANEFAKAHLSLGRSS